MDNNTRTQLATGILVACTLTGAATILSNGGITLANKPAILTEKDDSKEDASKPSLTDSDGTIATSDNTDSEKNDYTDKLENLTKDEFIKRLCEATGAKDIEIEDAGSYSIRTYIGANDSCKLVYYKVDGNTIYVTGYNNTNGNKVYFGNEGDRYYSTEGSNLVFSVGDEVTIESSEQLSHDEFFGRLKGSAEFVGNFSPDGNYDELVSLLDKGSNKMLTTTRTFDESMNLLQTEKKYTVDGELWYSRKDFGNEEGPYISDGKYSDNQSYKGQYSK